jgi:hypothetical protein
MGRKPVLRSDLYGFYTAYGGNVPASRYRNLGYAGGQLRITLWELAVIRERLCRTSNMR